MLVLFIYFLVQIVNDEYKTSNYATIQVSGQTHYQYQSIPAYPRQEKSRLTNLCPQTINVILYVDSTKTALTYSLHMSIPVQVISLAV